MQTTSVDSSSLLLGRPREHQGNAFEAPTDPTEIWHILNIPLIPYYDQDDLQTYLVPRHADYSEPPQPSRTRSTSLHLHPQLSLQYTYTSRAGKRGAPTTQPAEPLHLELGRLSIQQPRVGLGSAIKTNGDFTIAIVIASKRLTLRTITA